MRYRRYLHHGRVAHYVWVVGDTAACGLKSDHWLGGTMRTRDKAASLPRCPDCVRDAGDDW